MRSLVVLLLLVVWLILPVASTLAAPAERVLFQENFEHLKSEGAPPGWLIISGDWTLAQRDSGVLRQRSTDVTGDGWAVALWSDYCVVVKFQVEEGEGAWGAGLVAYMDDLGNCYRLRAGRDGLHLEELRGESVINLADVPVEISRGKWYSLRLGLSGISEGVHLRGKIWPGDSEEPAGWMLQATDDRRPLHGGSVGLWTGNCAARFALVSARRMDPVTEAVGNLLYGTDFSDTDQGRLPTFWATTGGVWVRDTVDELPVLRQMLRRPGPDYDGNAFTMLNWSGYTVSTRANAHPGTGKWGLGVVAYLGTHGGSYRLRLLDDKLYLAKRQPAGRVVTLASMDVKVQRGEWYNLRLTVENVGNACQLQGRLWSDQGTVPADWALSAVDLDNPLHSGAPGVWCFGGAADFDDFSVKTSVLSSLNAFSNP